MDLLISKTDISTVLQISASAYNDSIINEQIRNAQESDLRALMGDRFFFALIASPLEARFLDLLNEKQYVGEDGYVYYSFGIKAVLVYYAMARYFYYGQSVNTPFGTKIKENDYSRGLTVAEKKGLYIEKQNLALEKWRTVADYINMNRNIYQEYTYMPADMVRSFGKINFIR